jgi:hypothetical protein
MSPWQRRMRFHSDSIKRPMMCSLKTSLQRSGQLGIRFVLDSSAVRKMSRPTLFELANVTRVTDCGFKNLVNRAAGRVAVGQASSFQGRDL